MGRSLQRGRWWHRRIGTPRRGVLALAGLMAVALPCAARASEPLGAERQREILRAALDSYDQAIAVTRTNPPQAERLMREAARGFETLIDSGLRNARLEFNLGNAYYRLGDVGRAVLHLRRAERLDPALSPAVANLDFVRQRVTPHIAAAGGEQLTRRLLFWQSGTSLNARFWAAALLSSAGWLLLIARLRWRRSALGSAAATCIVLGALCGGLTAWQLWQQQRTPDAVIVSGEPVLRQGRGEGYEPVIAEPLGPGVELQVLDRRGDWLQVRLPNAREGWLPAANVERI